MLVDQDGAYVSGSREALRDRITAKLKTGIHSRSFD